MDEKKSYVKVDTAPDNVYSTGIFFKENLPLNISALHSILTKTIISVHKIEYIFKWCYMEFAK